MVEVRTVDLVYLEIYFSLLTRNLFGSSLGTLDDIDCNKF